MIDSVYSILASKICYAQVGFESWGKNYAVTQANVKEAREC